MEEDNFSMMDAIIALIVLTLMLVGIFWLVDYTSKEVYEYSQYKDFCEQRPSFCYCSWFSCEFKTSWSSVTGFSNETKELCDLATKLNDKETLFKVGCK
jgi:hypothetical protein